MWVAWGTGGRNLSRNLGAVVWSVNYVFLFPLCVPGSSCSFSLGPRMKKTHRERHGQLPDPPSSHGDIDSTTIHRLISFATNPESSWDAPASQANMKPAVSKLVGKCVALNHHSPLLQAPWQGQQVTHSFSQGRQKRRLGHMSNILNFKKAIWEIGFCLARVLSMDSKGHQVRGHWEQRWQSALACTNSPFPLLLAQHRISRSKSFNSWLLPRKGRVGTCIQCPST